MKKSILCVCMMAIAFITGVSAQTVVNLSSGTGQYVITTDGDYEITGTTTTRSVKINPGVHANVTLNNVSITTNVANPNNCIDQTGAFVVYTLVGTNKLKCSVSNCTALCKEGYGGSMTIQCESVKNGVANHVCDASCGSLEANGDPAVFHSGAIGSTTRRMANIYTSDFTYPCDNIYIKGGRITASAGIHMPGIGSACTSNEKISNPALMPGCNNIVIS